MSNKQIFTKKDFVREVVLQHSKTIRSSLIRRRSDTFTSDRYLINIDPMVFAIWAIAPSNCLMSILPVEFQTIPQVPSQIAKFMGPTWGPPGSCRPQMGPTLAPWTLLSGITSMAYCKTAVTSLLMHWSYYSLELSHTCGQFYVIFFLLLVILVPSGFMWCIHP